MGIVDLQGAVRYCTRCRAVYHSDFARCPNDGGELALSDDDPLVGARVAHYVVEAFIGGGAMGRVYRCHHSHLQHKQFALKVLRGDLAATMSMRLRFTQEAEAASRLVHPNLVSVLDFGRTEHGLLFIAMELVEGDTLTQLVGGKPMPISRVLQLARQLCVGLSHAHDHHLVHRDFKPDNILIVRDGDGLVPKIVDFGLAISADPDAAARFTTAGLAVGTPVYAAPEQMRDHPDVDHRADLFSLGVTMFEMLAGKVPFQASILETLHLNAASERPSIAERAPGVVVPPRLERLVQRLMSPEPSDRPASARAVFDELRIIELELMSPSAPITPPPAVDTTRRSSPLRRGITSAVIAAAFAGGAAMLVNLVRSPREPSSSPGTPTTLAMVTKPVASDVPAKRAQPVPVMDVPNNPAPDIVAKPVVANLPAPKISTKARAPKSVKISATPVVKRDVADSSKTRDDVQADPDPVTASPPGVPKEAQPDAPASPTRPATGSADAAPKPAPRLVTRAKLSMADLSVRGSLTPATIRRAVERVMPTVTACYGPAATRAGRSPSVDVHTRFEIDESQRAHGIQTASALPGLAECVDHALGSVRTEAPPDVGTEDVTFVFQFAPEGT